MAILLVFHMKYNHEVYNVLHMEKQSNRKKTEVASFRLTRETLEDLRKIAEHEKVSLNTLISQVLDQYLHWHYVAPTSGMIPQPKQLLITIFNHLSDDEIIEISNYVAETQVKSLMLGIHKEYSIESFMTGMEYWAKASNFPFSHIEKLSGLHQYIIQHEMGKNWSLYYEHVFKKILEQFNAQSIEIDSTDTTLIITFSN